MRISVAVIGSDVAVSADFIPLEVFPDMSLDDIKGFVEAEINVQPSAQTYVINDKIVTQTSRSLTDLGVQEGDVISLAIKTKAQNTVQSSGAGPSQPRARNTQQPQGAPDAEMTRLQILADERLLNEIQRSDPELAATVNDSQRFASVFGQRLRQRHAAQEEKERMLAALEADPLDIEAQRKIEEMIRQERVLENMQKALEENPESFGHVHMLYVDVLVNNVPIKAFVDSGAQTTIMSPDAAQRCGIMRLIDRRFSGIAKGVGTAQILGRVHSGDIQIGQYNLASSFTVMEGKDVDLLLGLDMLKRHQMCIDLRGNCLRIGDDKIPFLPENELPKMGDSNPKEETIPGPGGTKIGTETGTVKPATPTPSQQASQPSAASSTKTNIHPTGSPGNVSTGKAPASSSSSSTPSTISTQQPPVNSPFGAPAPITEQSIGQITQMGFSREEALAALQQTGGNVELAIGLLL